MSELIDVAAQEIVREVLRRAGVVMPGVARTAAEQEVRGRLLWLRDPSYAYPVRLARVTIAELHAESTAIAERVSSEAQALRRIANFNDRDDRRVQCPCGLGGWRCDRWSSHTGDHVALCPEGYFMVRWSALAACGPAPGPSSVADVPSADSTGGAA